MKIRTYIAALDVNPNFQGALTAPNSAARKTAAVEAMRTAEAEAAARVVPRLEQLARTGTITGFELVPLTGSVIVSVPDAAAAGAYDALRGVDGLGRIVRERTVKLDPSGPLAVEDAAAPPAPPTGPKIDWHIARVRAPEAWAAGVNGTGVTVGVVDSGADVTHPALKDHYRGTKADGSYDHSYNFVDLVNGKTAAYDDHGHGGHVAGTAVGGSAIRSIGVAPGAKFISAKAFNKSGSGKTPVLLKALSWMLAPRDSAGASPDPTKAPDIINSSWGDDSEFGRTLVYLDAYKAFDAAGIVTVSAAGNNGPATNAIDAPGSYAQGITVTATDDKNQVAAFASRGWSPIKLPDGTRIPKPDIAAPGTLIWSTGPNPKYWLLEGTSMATPQVAGVVALLKQRHPDLDNEQVRAILAQSARDLGEKGKDPLFGHGLVDAVEAIRVADEQAAARHAAARR